MRNSKTIPVTSAHAEDNPPIPGPDANCASSVFPGSGVIPLIEPGTKQALGASGGLAWTVWP